MVNRGVAPIRATGRESNPLPGLIAQHHRFVGFAVTSKVAIAVQASWRCAFPTRRR